MTKRLHIILSFIFAVVIAVSALVFPTSIPLASASETVVGAYEEQNIMQDLEGSTVGGKPFDVKDYPRNTFGHPQIIHFVEFCYSYDAEKQNDFGLYVYVYNPQQVAIDTDTERNKIEISYGSKTGKEYSKYVLEFLNYSMETGLEGRFYKFKLRLSDAAKQSILNNVNEDERVYEVVGIELSIHGKVEDHTCAQKYTYTGFAKGYGSELAEGDTVSAQVDGLEKFLELDIHHTYFQPKGTNGINRYTHDRLSSIYFAVPKDVVDEYGSMTKITGEYLKALSSEIFVTGDSGYYDTFMSVLGQDVGYLEPDSGDFEAMICAYEGRTIWGSSTDWIYNAPKEIIDYYSDDRYFSQLNYLFYAENGDADTYSVSSQQMQEYMDWFTEEYASDTERLVAGRYAEALFDSYDSEMTRFELTSDSVTEELTDLEISKTFWQALFGQETVNSDYYDGKEVIHEVTDDDFIYNAGTSEVNIELTCDNLYIAQSDYEEFRAFYELYKSDNVIYLVRFAVDDYASTEASQWMFERVGHHIISGAPWLTFVNGSDNSNCYLAQMYMYLDFDVIDVTYTKGLTSTTIPIVASPVDVIGDVLHPEKTHDDGGLEMWEIILAIVALIIVLIILAPLLPYVFKFLLWLLMLPAKLVVWIINLFKRKNE